MPHFASQHGTCDAFVTDNVPMGLPHVFSGTFRLLWSLALVQCVLVAPDSDRDSADIRHFSSGMHALTLTGHHLDRHNVLNKSSLLKGASRGRASGCLLAACPGADLYVVLGISTSPLVGDGKPTRA